MQFHGFELNINEKHLYLMAFTILHRYLPQNGLGPSVDIK